MSVAERAAEFGVNEILHFTTNRGVLGVLDARALKARARLNVDERLEYIFQPNAANRDKDAAWLDYVNLSVSRINNQFFGASGNWHRNKNFWWCVLSFDPAILDHAGVHFSTTNNIYTGVRRGQGEDGFVNMFAPRVVRWAGNHVDRSAILQSNYTTCVQAEVLYPGQVSTDFLKRIYVLDEQSADELAAQIHVLRHPAVPIEVCPRIFSQ
jgi:hypothetical protein